MRTGEELRVSGAVRTASGAAKPCSFRSSSGSACSSNHPGISGALKAIGVKPELLDSTIRFSFGAENTKEEVDICMDALRELLPVLRRFTRF